MQTLNQLDFNSKQALIRVDFNVPLNENFEVTDTTRIEAAKPTIMHVLESGGSVVLMSHLGRPNGKEEKFSLKHITQKVTDIIGVQVNFVADCVGEDVEQIANNLNPGEVLLLENLRFYKEEKKGDIDFSRQLSKLGDIYINDAFGTAHRAHASTTVVAQFFPNSKCFGNLLEREIKSINRVLNESVTPVTAILGGAKVSSKIGVIENILEKVDHIIVGGGMTFTFIKALGGSIGDSLVEEDKLELALEILDKAKKANTKIHLPVDAVIADSFSNEANTQEVNTFEIPEGWMGLDCGEKTLELFSEIISLSNTVLWNGPLGVFEMEKFSSGTITLGNAIAKATENGAFSLVGGGDSVAAVKQFGFANKVSYVSTGGGAMLEMLEGKTLPGIEAILK